jgi:hypothetical protein
MVGLHEDALDSGMYVFFSGDFLFGEMNRCYGLGLFYVVLSIPCSATFTTGLDES